MREYDVPVVQIEAAQSVLEYYLGEIGEGPKVPEPDIQPNIVQVMAHSKGEAAILAEKLAPGCMAIRPAIKARNDVDRP